MADMPAVFYRTIDARTNNPTGRWTKLTDKATFLPILPETHRYEIHLGVPYCGQVKNHMGVNFLCTMPDDHGTRHRWESKDCSMVVTWDED